MYIIYYIKKYFINTIEKKISTFTEYSYNLVKSQDNRNI